MLDVSLQKRYLSTTPERPKYSPTFWADMECGEPTHRERHEQHHCRCDLHPNHTVTQPS